MKTHWEWSLATEANRILQASRNIANGFYHTNNFPILPWTPTTHYIDQAVYLPPLDFSTLPRYWTKVTKLNFHQTPVPDPYHFEPALTVKLSHLNLAPPDIKTISSLWERSQAKIFATIQTLLPTTRLPRSLVIRPTYFGTSSSFNDLYPDQETLNVALRVDQNLWALTEALVTALIRPDAYSNFHANWSEVEFFVDFLLARSPLAQLLPFSSHPKPAGTIRSLRHPAPKVFRTRSTEFLTSIGAPTHQHSFTITDKQILYLGRPIIRLTDREQQIFRLLITRCPNYVSPDDLADLLFVSDEEYSLYTISKIIERLRTKLEAQGISSSFLATNRTKGYYLKQ